MTFESMQASVNALIIDTFKGETDAIYNWSTDLEGVFSNDYIDANGGANVEFQSSQPAFVCQAADVPSIARDDALLHDGVTYTVTGFELDGTGLILLKLRTA